MSTSCVNPGDRGIKRLQSQVNASASMIAGLAETGKNVSSEFAEAQQRYKEALIYINNHSDIFYNLYDMIHEDPEYKSRNGIGLNGLGREKLMYNIIDALESGSDEAIGMIQAIIDTGTAPLRFDNNPTLGLVFDDIRKYFIKSALSLRYTPSRVISSYKANPVEEIKDNYFNDINDGFINTVTDENGDLKLDVSYLNSIANSWVDANNMSIDYFLDNILPSINDVYKFSFKPIKSPKMNDKRVKYAKHIDVNDSVYKSYNKQGDPTSGIISDIIQGLVSQYTLTRQSISAINRLIHSSDGDIFKLVDENGEEVYVRIKGVDTVYIDPSEEYHNVRKLVPPSLSFESLDSYTENSVFGYDFIDFNDKSKTILWESGLTHDEIYDLVDYIARRFSALWQDGMNPDELLGLNGEIFLSTSKFTKNKKASFVRTIRNREVWNNLVRLAKGKIEYMSNVHLVENKQADDEMAEDEMSNKPKESWMWKAMERDPRTSLSEATRAILNNIPLVTRTKDGKYNPVKNSIGEIKYVDANAAHRYLQEHLASSGTINNMLSRMRRLSNNEPWIGFLLDKYFSNPSNKYDINSFFSDFNKEFLEIVKVNLSKNEAYTLNKRTATEYLMSGIKDTLNASNTHNNRTLWNNDYTITEAKLKAFDNLIVNLDTSINETFQRGRIYTTEDLVRWASYNKKELKRALDYLGFTLSVDDIINSFITGSATSSEDPNVLQVNGYGYVFNRFIDDLKKASNRLSELQKSQFDTNKGNIKFVPNDFYNTTLFYPYTDLSKIFQYSVESPIQSSFTNNGKTMYSYMNPSYMSRMMSTLCDESLSLEERRKLIEDKFGYSYWFADNDNQGHYYNVFLERLYNPRVGYESSRMLEVLKSFGTIKFGNNRDFEDFGNLDRELICISAYVDSLRRKQQTHNTVDRFTPFMLPALSDAPNKVMNGINFNFDEIMSITKDMIRQEFNRINVVKKLSRQDEKFKIQDYFKRGQHFVNLQALENFKIGNRSFYDVLNSAVNAKDSMSKASTINDILTRGAEYVLLDLVQNYVKKADKIGLFDIQDNSFQNLPNSFLTIKELSDIRDASEFSQDVFDRAFPKYVINTWLNTRQLMQLFIIDDAFYSGPIDQTKRIKEITAPVQSPAVSDEMQNVISLRVEDLEDFESDTAAAAKSLIKKFNAAGLISNAKANQLIKSWESGYNVTDGQTIIGAHTMQNILKAYGNYDAQVMDPIFNKLISNKALSTQEQYMFFQTLKPFYFSNEKASYTITNKDGSTEDYAVPVPTQYKNSEFLVAAIGLLSQNPAFMAFRDILDSGVLGARVDKIDFNSTVKHSNFAYVTGIKEVLAEHKGESVESIKNAIIAHIRAQVAEGGDNLATNKFFHSTPFSDYGISNSVPEEFADQRRALGSQVIRHAFSNVPDIVPFNVNTIGSKPITHVNIDGKLIKLDSPNSLTRQQYTELLAELFAQNIFEDDSNFHETLANNNDLVQFIYESAKKSDILTSEQIRALTPIRDKFGNLHPLVSYNSPSHSIKVQQLINSVFKKRVISQSTRGGMLVQTSAFGFTDELNIRYRDNNGNLIPTFNEWISNNPDKTRKDYEKYVDTVGVSSIDYMEAYLPSWSKKLIADLIDENGFIDINKKTKDGKYIVPESVRNLFAYRIPTEDTYSVVPIRVKGFLNNTTGGNIFLPAEITLITGSDFDIDKMFIALYALTKGKDGVYNKIEYDWSKPSYAQDQYISKQDKRDARNNAIIDLMYSKYTSPEAALEYVNPSSFDDFKIPAYTHRLVREGVGTYDELIKKSLPELKALMKSIDTGRDIYNPIERTLQMGRNNLGGRMIGIFAVNRVFHSSLQNYNAIHSDAPMSLIDEETPFGKPKPVFNLSFNPKIDPPKRILGQKYNDNGQLTSYIFGATVSASTDSVKDPILEDLNLNELTAPIFELLVSLGYDVNLVFLYLNQPAMLEVVRSHERNPYATLTQLLSSQAHKYYSMLLAGEKNDMNTLSFAIGEGKSVNDVRYFRSNSMRDLSRFLGYNDSNYYRQVNNNILPSPEDKLAHYEYAYTQLKVSNMLLNIAKYANLFNEASLTSRPDSRGASVGPNQIDNLQRIKRLNKYNAASPKLIANGIVVVPGLRGLRKRDLMTAIIKSPFPISQMFTSLGLESMAELESRIFSYSSPLYQETYDLLAEQLDMDVIPKKFAVSLMEDLIAFLSTTNTSFGNDNLDLYKAKRDYFTDNDKFHQEFLNFKKKYVGTEATAKEEDGVNITRESSFLNALSFYKKSSRIFLNDTMRSSDRFTQEWRDLYYAKVPVSEKYPQGYNPELRDMAVKLYMYNFFFNGMGFGKSTFHKYAPTEMQLAVHGYNYLLEQLPHLELDASTRSMATAFVKQFMLQNATDPRVAEQFNTKRLKEGSDYVVFDNGQYIARIRNQASYEGQVLRKPKQVLRDTQTQELYLMVSPTIRTTILSGHSAETSKLDSDNKEIEVYQKVANFWWEYPQYMLYYNTVNEYIFDNNVANNKNQDAALIANSDASNIDFEDNNRPTYEGQFESITEEDYLPSHFGDMDNDAGVPSAPIFEEEISDPRDVAAMIANVEGEEAPDFSEEEIEPEFNDNNGAMSENYSTSDLAAMDAFEEEERAYYASQGKNKTLSSIGEIRQKYSETLNTRIRQLCEQYNIPISAITELDARLKRNGVMEVQRADSIADMFTVAIRIAKNEVGEAALPEEFAHAVIAMLEGNPLHDRLMNAITLDVIKDVLGDNYDTYVKEYGGDIRLLTEETAGQLLAESFRHVNDNPQKTNIVSRLHNLLNRIKDFFRRLLGRIDTNEFEHAKAQATNLYNQLAMDILGGKIQFNNAMISAENRVRSLYSHTASAIEKKQRILERIIKKETEKLEIFKKKKIGSSSAERRTSQDLIDSLSESLNKNLYQHGIMVFLNTTLKQINYYVGEMLKYENAEFTENNIRAISRNIRMMKDLSSSFDDIIDNIINETIREDPTDQEWSDIQTMANNVKRSMDQLKILYKGLASQLFKATLNPLFVDARNVSRGKNKGKVLTDEDIYTKVDRDITGIDLWVDSLANSSNLMLRGVDLFVKKQKDAIRLKVIEHRKHLETLYSKAKNAGITSFDYMFQRDADGNLTGNFITPIDYFKYAKARDEKKAELLKKYGDEQSVEYKNAWNAWKRENYNELSHSPMLDKYKSEAYAKLESATDEQGKLKFQLYKEIMSLKEKFDLMLPEEYRHKYRAPQIRKDLVERLRDSQDVKSGLISLGESIRDQFVMREDETDYGFQQVNSDFSGREIESLPIYFVEYLKNKNDLSTDIISTMLAYANMAEYFNGFNNVIDLLEVGRDVVSEMKTPKRKGSRPMRTVIKRGEDTVVDDEVLVSADNVIKKYNDFLSSQVYKKFYKDAGTFGDTNISKSKVGNAFISLTAVNNLAFNLISGISNVTTGNLQMWTEALAGSIVKNGAPFKMKAVGQADKAYFKALAGFLGDVGARVKQSKLALWDEAFDVLLEFNQDIADANYDRNRFAKMFSSSALFFFNTGGEHWMQNRTSLALAFSYPMIDNNGNATNLWDAMEVKKEYDGNGNLLTARLVIKDGYRKADGSEFTKKDLSDFKFKTASVNHELHGIYNKDDQSKMQTVVWGRMVMLFRRWMKPFWNRRWAGLGRDVEYDMETGDYDEGYYVTVGRFIKQAIDEIRAGQFSIQAFKDSMTDRDRGNIVKAAFEMLCIMITAGLINFIDWPDKKHSNWGINMTELQVKRLLTEIGCMSPTHLVISEGLNVLKSPTACVDYLDRILKIFNFSHYGEVIQSGRYKGHTRGYKYWMDIMPMNRTVFKVFNPDEAVKFYNQK